MIGIINDNGTLKRVSPVIKDSNNQLITQQKLNIAYNLNGEILSYPKKENMLLNLCPQTWLLNTRADSSFLCDASFTTKNMIPTDNGTFGRYNPTVGAGYGADNGCGVSNGADKYWYIGNTWDHSTLVFEENLYSNQGKLTMMVTFKTREGPGDIQAWTSLLGTFNNNNNRVEFSNNKFFLGGSYTGPIKNTNNPYPITSWISIALVIDGRNVDFYLEGVKTLSCINSADNNSWTEFNFNSRQPGGSFSGKIMYRNIRIWKDALTAEEIQMMKKIESIGF